MTTQDKHPGVSGKKTACYISVVYVYVLTHCAVQAPEHDTSEFYLQNPPQHSIQTDEWLQHKENLLLGRSVQIMPIPQTPSKHA